MRIIILGAKGFPSALGAGGVERGVFEVATRLAKQGHEVIVYQRAKHLATYNDSGVIIRSMPYIDSQALACWSHMLFSLVDALFRWRAVEIYHVHCAQNGFFCLPLRLTGSHVVFHLHGREWRTSKWSWFMRGLMRASCFLGAISAHSVVTVCHPSLELLYRWLPHSQHKIHFIPNGVPEWTKRSTILVDSQLSSPKPEAPIMDCEPPFFLYAGRLVPQKRIDLLIQAVYELAPEVRLVIAGSRSHCKSYITKLKDIVGDSKQVLWVEHLDSIALRDLYWRCLAVVLPSESEGCSNVLLEALAAGCCIVASDIPENQDVLGDAAAFFRSGDLTSLVQVLSHLVANNQEVENRQKSARVLTKSLLTWNDISEQLLSIYQSDVSSSPRTTDGP